MKIIYNLFVVLILICSFMSCTNDSQSTRELSKMNVLHIVIEDWNAEALACYGNDITKTPYIDALSAKGMQFNRAYCQAAVCNPSRASFTTGVRPDGTKIFGNADVMDNVMPDSIAFITDFIQTRSEIHTAQLGKLMHKWHHSKKRINGFKQVEYEKPFAEASGEIVDHEEYRHYYHGDVKYRDIIPTIIPEIPERNWVYVPNKPVDQRMQKLAHIQDSMEVALGKSTWDIRKPFQQLHAEQCGNDGFDEVHTEDGILARVAARMLGDYAKDEKQFFLSVGLYAPHTPLLAPQKYIDMYPYEDMPLTVAPHSKDVNVPNIARRNGNNYDIFNGMYPEYAPTLENQQKAIAAYYACTSFIDAQVGVILDALKDNGLDENTIVVLFADHGFHLGEHDLWSKFTLFEQSTRVPFIIHIPGMETMGQECNEIVELVDFVPTLCDIWNIQPHEQFEGISILPLIEKPERPWKKAAFSVQSKPLYARSVRSKQFKYCEYRKNTYSIDADPVDVELYDLINDPWEQNNIVNDPAYAEIVNMHYHLLRDGWRAALPPTVEIE